ncbi:Pre-mRNA cleavage complex II protein Clp1-domain-containing protein [Lipomyces tetrasporus]|uniref:Polynucleotide 5'-hydroxyl-kinase GRC3 n=1 Tax=Lipomyces tetrasporus TaxID=54092 RepID=A0AAD7QQL8_9ASCO|nr:Pre-mRNA cleavage complex II protein Clp1-domain-containing protein [Lipomyces tetrasporus]KAJ8099703.1 Pre-mRNA cleavage complex II protein Clp1-domain-containing protein [Lipomyces tetrasporus]
MNLPGLSCTGQSSITPAAVDLRPETEWRFEVGLDSIVTVKVLQGHAEIFGTELAVGPTYTFTTTKLSIFTWRGCRFEWSGDPLAEYISEESVMGSYANLHFALEKLRMQAAEKDTQYNKEVIKEVDIITSGSGQEGEGPRVLIIGPRNSGKTTLAKILTAYAVKMNRCPMVVSLDPKEGMLSLPGTISAASFSTMMDIEEEESWGSSATTGPMHIPPKNPAVYYFGSDSPTDNIRFYKSLVSRLSLAISSRLAVDHKARISGCIIDAAGIIDQKEGYDLIDAIVADLSVDVVVTIGNERLYNDLLKRYQPRKQIAVLKVQRSGGVVEHDASYMRSIQRQMIKQYFYGPPKTALSAFTITADISAMTVYKRSEQSHLVSSSALPIGSDETTAMLSLVTKIEVSPALQNAILAVLYASPGDTEDDIAEASVMGFVHVLDIDEVKKKLKVLMPIKARLPSQVYLVGSYHYLE